MDGMQAEEKSKKKPANLLEKLAEKGKKSRGQGEMHDIYMNLYLRFVDSDLSTLAPFPKKFLFVEYEDGSRLPVEVSENRVLTHVIPQRVVDEIMRYTQFTIPHLALKFMPRNGQECYQLLKSLSTPIPYQTIKPIAQQSESGYCWHRLPFDIVDGECPTFNELVSRTTAPEIVKAFIGSLLCAESDRQQYLWLYGSGRNGKSRLANLLRRIMGPSYKAEVVPDKGMQRFWTSGLLSKRLVVFDDCNNYGFPSSGFFKMLTGSEAARVERKGVDSFDAELSCKFMFLSNEKPEIHHNIADIRRALYIEIMPIAGPAVPTSVYDSLLWAEAPHILAECLRSYNEVAADHSALPTEKVEDALLGVIDDTEERYLEMIRSYWDVDIDNPNWYATSKEFNEWVTMMRMDKHTERMVRKILLNRFGVRSVTRRIMDVSQRVYAGMKEKSRTSQF